jgi:hypothetical protein
MVQFSRVGSREPYVGMTVADKICGINRELGHRSGNPEVVVPTYPWVPFVWKAIQYGPEAGVLLTMLNAPFDWLIENSVTVGGYECNKRINCARRAAVSNRPAMQSDCLRR